MKYVKGDAVDLFKRSSNAILIHQVNCEGSMGAGIAKQIKHEFPHHYQDYIDFLKVIGGSQSFGHYVLSECTNNNRIFGLFGQYNASTKSRMTNYSAFAHGMFSIMEDEELTEKDTIIIPKYIGCGLGGGDWSIIEQILLDTEAVFGVTFICVEFDGKQ